MSDDPVRDYYESWKEGADTFDEERLRAILAPDLDFVGPIAGHRVGADGFLRGLLDFVRLTRSFQPVAEVRTGDEVAVLYDCEMAPAGETMRFAEFFRIAGGRIAALRLLYDPDQFRRIAAAAKEVAPAAS